MKARFADFAIKSIKKADANCISNVTALILIYTKKQ